MSDWLATFWLGMAMTLVFVGLLMLLYRHIVKMMRAEREGERRRRRSFDREADQ